MYYFKAFGKLYKGTETKGDKIMFQDMTGFGTFIMCLGMGIGIALGLFLLAGTFYLIWRFIRAIEKRETKYKQDK